MFNFSNSQFPKELIEQAITAAFNCNAIVSPEMGKLCERGQGIADELQEAIDKLVSLRGQLQEAGQRMGDAAGDAALKKALIDLWHHTAIQLDLALLPLGR